MPAGIQIFNPSGELLISSDSINYGYAGTASLITSGTKTNYHYNTSPYDFYYGEITPFIFEYNSGSSTIPPLFGVLLSSSQVLDISAAYLYSGTTWRCSIMCYGTATAGPWQNIVLGSAPTVYAFTPYTNADAASGAGIQLFNSAGNLSFTLTRKPMWIKRAVDFPGVDATLGDVYPPDQGVAWTSLSSPLMINGGGGGWVHRFSGEGEDVFFGGYGFNLGVGGNAGKIMRTPYLSRHEVRADDLPGSGTEYALGATRLFLVDGSLL